MLGIETQEGFGLGNQLFFYITTRCIAMDKGYQFSVLDPEHFANNMHSDCGLYFMDLDYGVPSKKEDYQNIYHEKEDRLFVGNSKHDLTHGVYITDTDKALFEIADNTLLYGNFQAEDYFIRYKEEIKEWLRVKPEYDCKEYSRDNLCILHLRCSDYMDSPELYLRKKYWIQGMKQMRKINPDMEFMIITNDVKEAGKFLPGIPAYNFDLAKDYSILKNAKYLLLANSSFAYFPAFTSESVQYILAPKYWARHNVSDGYWASEQNIYAGWHYMDRHGRVFSDAECRKELEEYKKSSRKYAHINERPQGLRLKVMEFHGKYIYGKAYCAKIARGVKRRIKKLFGGNGL
ncbi:MAG: glycosyl transferase [Lachnospiraceae bacterium]|nr:glycosyl transferase [Lachnospiraceae bacterium]